MCKQQPVDAWFLLLVPVLLQMPVELIQETGGATRSSPFFSPQDGGSKDTGQDHFIRIISPLNDTVLATGSIVVSIETHGFIPSPETPIEVQGWGGNRE